jgi:glucosamine--fructose-6-phosphate aminotransferase (isomerizing)
MILISQSGRSPDLLRAAEEARAAGVTLVGLINDETSPLAAMVDILVPVVAGPERSVAATKSVIATMAAAAQLIAAWGDLAVLDSEVARLPDQLAGAWDADWGAAIDPIASADHLFVLGRDLTLGPAQEAALKFKETAGLHAEAFSLAEVAHGPMALVGPAMPVLAFPSEAAIGSGALDLIAGFRARGATVMMAGHIGGGITLPLAEADPATRPILILQSFYRLAEAVARARGHDPDHPPSLKKVTETL